MFSNTDINLTLFGSLFGRSQQSLDLTTRLFRRAPQVCYPRRFVLKLAECIALFVVLIVLSLVIFFNLVHSSALYIAEHTCSQRVICNVFLSRKGRGSAGILFSRFCIATICCWHSASHIWFSKCFSYISDSIAVCRYRVFVMSTPFKDSLTWCFQSSSGLLFDLIGLGFRLQSSLLPSSPAQAQLTIKDHYIVKMTATLFCR